MKNIKFRAWNKVKETIITDAINNSVDSFEMILKHPQIYDVMQYTGLKDKNGVDIYEGDILVENNDKTDLVQVCFGEFEVRSIATEKVIDKTVGWYLKVIPTDTISKLEPFCYDAPLNNYWIKRLDIKAIGNIYDNPELLQLDKKVQ